ncbi:MAG: amidohydrolase family protein [Phycisphaeraceae bacterium JB051]
MHQCSDDNRYHQPTNLLELKPWGFNPRDAVRYHVHHSMTTPLIHLANATVIDPTQPDPPRDLFIHDGRIIAAPDAQHPRQTIDLDGQVVLPGGIDMHTHLVTPAMAALRTLQEHVIPDDISSQLIGTPTWLRDQYLKLGITTAIDAAITPGDAPAAKLGLRELEPLNTGFLLLLSHHADLLPLINAGHLDAATALATKLFNNAGAMGIKLVNPGSMQAMDGPALDVIDIDQAAQGMTATPRQVLSFFLDLADKLNLAHPIHIHLPQLGTPDSAWTTCQWLDALQGRRAHLAHLQYHCYDYDDDWYLRSDVERVLKQLQANPQITADVGLTTFGPAYGMTADLALHDRLVELFGDEVGPTLRFQWEGRTSFGLQPLARDPQNLGYAMQWATGLELILLADNLNQLSLSIDYPNGGAIANYPQLIRCLMDKSYRDAILKEAHPAATQATTLKHISRQLTFDEVLQLTRTSPAKALGLKNKGNLHVGSDADLVIYPDAILKTGDFCQTPARVMINGRFL